MCSDYRQVIVEANKVRAFMKKHDVRYPQGITALLPEIGILFIRHKQGENFYIFMVSSAFSADEFERHFL